HRIGSASESSSLSLPTAPVPRLYLGAIIYPHVHAPKYILHRLSRSCTDPSFLSCATHRNVLSLDVAKGRRCCWRRCFRFGRKVAAVCCTRPCYPLNSSSNALASCKSAVSKPSVNHP